MFTVEQINQAHKHVKSGADFPKYIQEIKLIGVTAFETWVKDSHAVYYGANGYHTSSKTMCEDLTIADTANEEKFLQYLKYTKRERRTILHSANIVQKRVSKNGLSTLPKRFVPTMIKQGTKY